MLKGRIMRNLKVGAALLTLVLIGAALGYWFASRTQPSLDAAGSGAMPGRKVLYWHDPMVPGQRFDKPGKSPFMDMQLVPVYADEASSGTAVRVTAHVTQNLGIRLGRVERTMLQPRLTAVGSVAFDERRLQLVQVRIEGYVTRLYVKAPLVQVRRGQPLADIVAPQWLAAQDEYLTLLDARSERGQAVRTAARQRLQILGIPEDTIRAIERDRKSGASTTLLSPAEGVVSELSIREGTAFEAGAPLFRINGLDTVWVNAQVPEAQVAMVPSGSTVTARAMAWPGVAFTGRVLDLLPDVDPQTRTLPVRIELSNPDHKLAPGMFVSLELTAAARESQLVVPSEAVIVTGERSAVIVASEDGGFDVAEVTTGTEAEGKTVILSGLMEGQPIVLSGQFLIDSEASLKSAVSRLSAGAGEAGAITGAQEAPSEEGSSVEKHP
jgi:membrane fusion protein, copper/silver efflux system